MKLLSETKTLTAAACNAQMELPLQSLVREIIDAATDHANALGFGYDRLLANGNAWVLSRLCVEMQRFPAVGDTYTLTTPGLKPPTGIFPHATSRLQTATAQRSDTRAPYGQAST